MIRVKPSLLFIVMLSLFCAIPASSATGLMSGQKNIQIIYTKYFDIIFPQESEESAKCLALSADSIYDEICTSYNIEHNLHIPVVLSPASDYTNAYYSGWPYNHIVLLDTKPTISLSVFSDDLLGIFKHELCHAVTYNAVGKHFRISRAIFNNAISLSPLSVVPLMAEGASVAMESLGGEGRLSDGFFLHTVRQAKLQGEFPSYVDVTGARDAFNMGLPYSFGGPFTAFLQEQYGMEKYVAWWYACLCSDRDLVGYWKSRLRTYAGYFKSAYGFSLEEAWKNFEDSIYIPQIAKSNAKDFFAVVLQKDDSTLSRQNTRGSRYTNLTASKKGLSWLDAASECVYFSSINSNGTFSAPVRLFSGRHVQRLSFSSDGRFLAASTLSTNKANYQNEVLLYDTELSRLCAVKDLALRDAVVVKTEGGYLLCGVRTASQKSFLEAYPLDISKKVVALKTKEAIYQKDFPKEQSVFSLCDSGKGRLFFIFKNALSYSLQAINGLGSQSPTLQEYALPLDGIKLESLSAGLGANGTCLLTFSYATKDSFPRLGVMNTETAAFYLSASDISGGVYFPVLLGEKLCYSGYFVNDYKLFIADAPSLQEAKGFEVIFAKQEKTLDTAPAFSPKEEPLLLSEAKPYKRLYYSEGTFIPLSFLAQYDKDLVQTSFITMPGATYITSNPWDSASLSIGAGFDFFSKTGGTSLSFTGDTSPMGTGLYSYSVNPTVLFDKKGFKQATCLSSLTLNMNLGLTGAATFSLQDTAFIGREHSLSDEQRLDDFIVDLIDEKANFSDIVGISAARGTKEYVGNAAGASAVFSNVRKTGPGRYENFGIQGMFTYEFLWQAELGNVEHSERTHLLSPAVSLYIPRLIPIDCAQGKTYNLPLSLYAALSPTKSALISAKAEAVVYACEIQRGLSWIPLYANRFLLTLSYSGHLEHDGGSFAVFSPSEYIGADYANSWRDAITASGFFTFTVNTGLLSNVPLTMGISYGYRPHRSSEENAWFITLSTKSLMF